MAIDFPNSPSLNQVFSAGGNSWAYDGEKWVLVSELLYLDDLADVDAASPSNGEFLKWDGSAWVPGVVTSIESLDDIGDVNVSLAVVGDVLKFDGANWISASATTGVTSLSALTDVELTDLQDGQIIKYSLSNNNWYNEYEAIQNVDGGLANTVYGGIVALSGGGAAG